MAKLLFILNGPPYGNEHSFNGLRLADKLVRMEDNDVRVLTAWTMWADKVLVF